MIQPAGRGGSPSAGHRCTAAVNASWTASSATSMSPNWRTRTATARPYSSRNTRSISEMSMTGTPMSALGFLLEGAHLDRSAARPRRLRRPCERGVEIWGPDHPEPADVLLALGKGAVRREHLAVLDPDHGGRVRGVQPPGEHPRPGLLNLGVEGVHVPVHLLDRLRGWQRFAIDHVNAEQVLLHRGSSLTVPPAPCRRLTLYTNGL